MGNIVVASGSPMLKQEPMAIASPAPTAKPTQEVEKTKSAWQVCVQGWLTQKSHNYLNKGAVTTPIGIALMNAVVITCYVKGTSLLASSLISFFYLGCAVTGLGAIFLILGLIGLYIKASNLSQCSKEVATKILLNYRNKHPDKMNEFDFWNLWLKNSTREELLSQLRNDPTLKRKIARLEASFQDLNAPTKKKKSDQVILNAFFSRPKGLHTDQPQAIMPLSKISESDATASQCAPDNKARRVKLKKGCPLAEGTQKSTRDLHTRSSKFDGSNAVDADLFLSRSISAPVDSDYDSSSSE